MTMVKAVPPMPKCWRKETKAHKFCPGCGHGIILKILGEVIDELGIQKDVIFVCDIGCSLLAWDLFNMDAVQTHHGRATPVAVGIKRANPKAICIAYMGDGGGYAIGAQHLVNAAARNERITLILANNSNYAMTGGEMSPTTLIGQKTETSPYGRDVETQGMPTKGAEMMAAIVSPGAYVARSSVANFLELKRYLREALLTQINGTGFSFVESLSTCPTNWHTNNNDTWRFLEEDMESYFPCKEFYVSSKEGK